MAGEGWHLGSLRTFRQVKKILQYEPYLDLRLPCKVINMFTRLRGGYYVLGSILGDGSAKYDMRIAYARSVTVKK